MTRSNTLAPAAIAGLVLFTLVAIRIEARTAVPGHGAAFLLFGLSVSWAFVVAGVIARRRRPGNRTGLLMIATGFAWLGASLTDSPNDTVFTIGLILGGLWPGLLLQLLLSYPTGTLDRRARWLVWLGYACTFGLTVAEVPFTQPRLEGGADARSASNLLLVSHQPGVVTAMQRISLVIGLFVTAGVLWTVWGRWRSASAATRRVLAPVYVTAAVAIGVLVLISGVLQVLGFASSLTTFFILAAAFTAIPIGYLFGILRTRLDRSTAVEALLAAMREQTAPGGLRDALRVALNDPSLDLAYRRTGTDEYLDVGGGRYELPVGNGRAVTGVKQGADTVAVLVHDPFLLDDPDLIEAVSGAAALSISNERLQAELRASRARIVVAEDAERRRLERNLHDGAQQRLVSLSLAIRMARSTVAEDSETARLLEAAGAELAEALDELRELARGIHPAILTDQGLAAAIGALTARSHVPTTVSIELESELDGQVEAAVYYVVAEAITNIAKYSRASSAGVVVTSDPTGIDVTVTDNGVGGADPSSGSGLSGLADRVEVLSGTIRVESPVGEGTRITAHLPPPGAAVSSPPKSAWRARREPSASLPPSR
jgi:signal transduction histidine kinase